MTTGMERIFEFIDFLIGKEKQITDQIPLIEEYESLKAEKRNLNRDKFKERLRIDNIDARMDELKNSLPIIQKEIISKMEELGIVEKNNRFGTSAGKKIIEKFKEQATEECKPTVKSCIEKYVELRKNIAQNPLVSTLTHIMYLDGQMKNLYLYFDETGVNEFDDFIDRPIKINQFKQSGTQPPTSSSTPAKDVANKNACFARSFTDAERQKLFDGLINGGFIPTDTNRNHFAFVFGGVPIPDNEKPFQPLKWMKNKQLLRELLTEERIKECLTNAGVERITPDLFIDKKGNLFKLSKNKHISNRDSKKIVKIFATL